MQSFLDFSLYRISKLLIPAIVIALSTTVTAIPVAFAAAPVISTKGTIANGAEPPPIYVEGAGFAADNDKFDFTVDMGTTGLEYDSVAFVNETHMRFNFHGTANTGTITIQANTSAYFPVTTEPSNILSIVVPFPLIPQIITFTTPEKMMVKDKDQVPVAYSSSGLTVVLTSNTQSICTIDFLKIHAVAAGTCSITASASGDLIYASAVPVTRSFSILPFASAGSNVPVPPVENVTNLGSAAYDPMHTDVDYVSVLVASKDVESKKATLVNLLVSPGTTVEPAVFLISSFSSDEETAMGYFVARIKLVTSIGKAIAKLKKHIEINIPAGAALSVPSWSLDGQAWYKLRQFATKELPADYHAGYFVEKDSRINIFTDYLMLFGHRKLQEQLHISSPVLLAQAGVATQISNSGGSGTGSVRFYSRTEDICSITPTGLMSGLSEGRCIVAAKKEATGIYSNATSSALSIYIQQRSNVSQSDESDLNHATLCQELSYTLLTRSTFVYVNLCHEEAGKLATLEVGTKSKFGRWSFKRVMKQKLDKNGSTLFNLDSVLQIGQIIRIKTEGKLQISTTINMK